MPAGLPGLAIRQGDASHGRTTAGLYQQLLRLFLGRERRDVARARELLAAGAARTP
jgi:hypothetical protein